MFNSIKQSDKANLLALDKVIEVATKGILGQFLVVIFVAIFINKHVPNSIIFLGILAHILAFTVRILMIKRYKRNRKNIKTYKEAKNSLKLYLASVLITSFLWGILAIYLYTIDYEAIFFIYAIIMGLSYASILSIGLVIEIYLAFTLPMLIILFFVFFGYGDTSIIAALFIIVAQLYSFATVLGYSRNFKSVIIEKEKVLLQVQIIEQIQDSIISTDLDGNIVTWNLGSQKMLGYSSDEIIGKHMSIFHREEDKELFKEYQNILLEKGFFNADVFMVKKSKELVPVSVHLSLLKDTDNKVIGLIGINHDITQRKEAEIKLEESHRKLLKQKEELKYQAHHDVLTKLPNRVLFNDRLEFGIKNSKRNGTKLALFFMDIDHFKDINDSLGHKVGDEILVKVSKRFTKAVRSTDTISRLGGDEFTVIMNNLQDISNASELAKKMMDALKDPIIIENNSLHITISIGISIYPDDSDNIQDLLINADIAMYRAKENGRNNYMFYAKQTNTNEKT